LKKILTGLVDLVFPPRCISCDQPLTGGQGRDFCVACYDRISFVRSPICLKCGIPFKSEEQKDHLCGDCLTSNTSFSAARCVGRYEETLLHCIHQFKYNEHLGAGKILGRLMAEYEYPTFTVADYTLVMPIPLHPKRLRQRGFNQALILARIIAKQHQRPVDFMALKRQIYTEPQVNLGRNEREKNIRGAFKVADAGRIDGEKILLVDDVYTTGSTVNECAKVLMKAGAKDVGVLTLARAI
jgi:ComF family protein